MCGGTLEVQEGMSVAECEYCGTTQTVPNVDDEKKITLFKRANKLRADCYFDQSAVVYESIVKDFPEEAEAYWGILLCTYGIEYVDDPATGKKIPTCHRSSFDSIMDDSNFELVMENADVVARKVYREEAKAIEEIRKGIIEISGKEEPYDIFICYKETDENGDRTIDSEIAQDVYDTLTDKGYRVFFARITLEDKLGQEYEPYIFAALNSAKLMLVFGTDYEYFNAVWVKNEWSRFLRLMGKDKTKALIPCYKNVDAYDMPKEFGRLQAQDMGKVGAMQDLMRGVEKIMPNNSHNTTYTTSNKKPHSNSSPESVSNIVHLGFMDLSIEKYESANSSFREALKIDTNCAGAYFGLALSIYSENFGVDEDYDTIKKETSFYMSNLYKLSPDISNTETEYINENNAYDCICMYIEYCDASRIKYILKNFPEVSINYHTPPLSYAIEKEQIDAVRAILEEGADVNKGKEIVDEDGNVIDTIKPLADAIFNNPNKEIFNLLLKHGADVNYCDIPILTKAIIEADNLNIVKALIEAGANVNQSQEIVDQEGNVFETTPLSAAIFNNPNEDIFKLLLKHGADVNYVEHIVFKSGSIGDIPILTKTIIHADKPNIVKALIEAGANPNQPRVIKSKSEYTNYASPLQDAMSNSDEDIVKMLVKFGADVNRIEHMSDDGTEGEISMIGCALNFAKNINYVKLLLDAGANIELSRKNIKENGKSNIYSSLSDAIWNLKDEKMVKTLIEYGANVNRLEHIYYDDGTEAYKSMLAYAITSTQNINIVKMLLDAGASWEQEISIDGIKRKIGKFPFKKLGVDSEFLKQLSKLGYKSPLF